MWGRGLAIAVAEWVRSGWRWTLSTALLLLFAACGGDDAGTADARASYDASLDAHVLSNCEQLQLDLQTYVDDKIENDVVDYAGLIAGVDTPACGVQTVATGLANVDPETPMTPQHLLPVASISKTLVATRVLQLADEELLSLDDTLSTWRTDVVNADQITVRHLLSHRSGLPNYRFSCVADSLSDPDREWTIQELVDCLNGQDAVCPPGICYSYSNPNFMLLGYIVEMVTGNALHDELRAHVLTPLGLDHTFTLGREDPPGDVARSYFWQGSWTDVTDLQNFSFCYGAGDMASSVGDLLSWAKALSTGATLEEETASARTTCVDGYGLGVMCGNVPGSVSVLGHPGRLQVAVSDMWYSEAWDSSVVVLINHGQLNDPDETSEWVWSIVNDVFAIVGEHR